MYGTYNYFKRAQYSFKSISANPVSGFPKKDVKIIF